MADEAKSKLNAECNGPASDDHLEAVELKPKITLINGITVIVGSIIGSGIFVSPRGVLLYSGSVGVAILIWILCGLYSMIGAYCYAELGTSIVRSGADYAYIFEAFGPFLAFLRLWVECIIVRPGTTAIVALTFAYYVIEPLFAECEQPRLAVTLLAAFCISKHFIQKNFFFFFFLPPISPTPPPLPVNKFSIFVYFIFFSSLHIKWMIDIIIFYIYLMHSMR